MMIANTDDQLIYEQLGIIINEFEKAALTNGKRTGALITAHSPLTAMDNMLEASDATLSKIKTSRNTDEETDTALLANSSGLNFELDEDLAELFTGDDAVSEYLKDCLNCSTRLKFDWQLKPLNLLGGIEGLQLDINKVLDGFELQLDPYKSLEGICGLLNLLKTLCLPDLIITLLSLKMLLKKYVSDCININLDWTVVLGPLLKVIIEGVATLLEQLTGVILSPLDCTINALTLANEFERESKELVGQAATFANASLDEFKDTVQSVTQGRLPANIELNGTAEDYTWAGSTLDQTKYPSAPQFGGFVAAERELNSGDTAFSVKEQGRNVSVPNGFDLKRDTKLDEALRDINFANSTATQKLLLPMQEAQVYIRDLLENILKSLNSVQALVSGGLDVQMGKIGIILFLSDVISLLTMMIQMLRQYPDVKDWCQQLEQNPHILEEALKSKFNPGQSDIRVDNGDNNTLILSRGPQVLMEIATCSSNRTTPQSALIEQWIKDLNRKGSQ